MTSCKEIRVGVEKRTKFQVEIDIKGWEGNADRKVIADYLKSDERPSGSGWIVELAEIIEKG